MYFYDFPLTLMLLHKHTQTDFARYIIYQLEWMCAPEHNSHINTCRWNTVKCTVKPLSLRRNAGAVACVCVCVYTCHMSKVGRPARRHTVRLTRLSLYCRRRGQTVKIAQRTFHHPVCTHNTHTNIHYNCALVGKSTFIVRMRQLSGDFLQIFHLFLNNK